MQHVGGDLAGLQIRRELATQIGFDPGMGVMLAHLVVAAQGTQSFSSHIKPEAIRAGIPWLRSMSVGGGEILAVPHGVFVTKSSIGSTSGPALAGEAVLKLARSGQLLLQVTHLAQAVRPFRILHPAAGQRDEMGQCLEPSPPPGMADASFVKPPSPTGTNGLCSPLTMAVVPSVYSSRRCVIIDRPAQPLQATIDLDSQIVFQRHVRGHIEQFILLQALDSCLLPYEFL